MRCGRYVEGSLQTLSVCFVHVLDAVFAVVLLMHADDGVVAVVSVVLSALIPTKKFVTRPKEAMTQ